MATATMATAAGAAALLYYTLNRRSSAAENEDDNSEENEIEDENNGGMRKVSRSKRAARKRLIVRPAQAPATWFETLSTLSETLRFTYSETLGKWPIGDLAFGINFLLRRQGHLHVASVYAGSDSKQLTGPSIVAELKDLLNLLTMCIHFSKKPFHLFLEATGYSKEYVLLQEPKAGLLKPAFTILVDDKSHSFLLLIRGTHSIKDTLTAVTGAVVPFHHTVLGEGGVSNLVLGYAHCGMVAAARWISQLAVPCLIKALEKHPDYSIKVVGHSLGGGTAALLTYILREHKEFSSTHCITFAPAACMTWELAESGTQFITAIINGSDLVPTFSATSVDDLRVEVTASAWVNDFREQIERTRFLSTVYRSASALGSRLPSIANARDKVAKAGAIWRPVSNSTQVVMKQAQTMAQAVVRTRPSLGISGWSCMGARRRTVSAVTSSTSAEAESKTLIGECSKFSEPSSENTSSVTNLESATLPISGGEGNIDSTWGRGLDLSYCSATDEEYRDHELDEVEEDDLINSDSIIDHSEEQDISEDYIWHRLEQELKRKEENQQEREEEAEAAKEIIQEEENVVAAAVENAGHANTDMDLGVSDENETIRFYPPGKIMHIVSTLPSDTVPDGIDGHKAKVGIYLTSRALYGKLRLSRTMINDHYMPVYKRMMEQLINELEQEPEENAISDDILDKEI
ncbi:hypothetical protein SUGI_0140070 [Cryptomeria japonica]|uniref:uncharacterized protein LOC131054456 n=1 Tax=Cryptomeria japonica TaxID=3369 RepID=UPI00240898A5|nr:uncharacterized protein LOC131054456 [Cryptomeria japonica]GLJ11000.1 hypothetical protein SUGI_0140070 [Cryptomeria japonica]